MPHKYKLTEAPNLARDIDAKVGDFHYSSDGDTKFTVVDVDDQTGAVQWDILNLPSFEKLFTTLDKAITTSRGVYTKLKTDTKFRDIYDEIRKIRNSYRTHMRNEYPDEYSKIRSKGLIEVNIPDPTSWADPDDEEKEQMKVITGPLKDLIKKFTLKKEESTSGAAGAYNTPYAFVRKPLKPKGKNKKNKSKYRMKMPSGLVNYMDYSINEGHGLDQGDVDFLQSFVDRMGVGKKPVKAEEFTTLKRILQFIIKSNILQDKTRDLSKGKANENIGAIAGGIAAARNKRRKDEEFRQIFDLAKEMGVDVTKYEKYLNENIDLERLGVGYATPNFKRGDEVDYLGRKAKVRSAKYNVYDKSFDYTVEYRDDNNQRTSADGVKDNDLKSLVKEDKYFSLEKGDKLKVNHPEYKNLILTITNPKGSGYEYISKHDGAEAEKGFAPAGYFSSAIERGDAELINEGIGNKINIARAKSHFKQGEKIAAINKKTKKVTKITGANQFGSFNPKEYDFAYLNENKGKLNYTEDEVKYSIGVDDDYEGWIDVAFQKGFTYDESEDQWYGPSEYSTSFVEEKDPDSEAERKRDEKHDKLMKKIRRGDALGLGSKRLGENEDRDLLETSWDYKDELGDIEKRIGNLYREMENDPDVEAEGGPVADQYGDELNKLERRQYALKRWLKWYDTDGGVDTPAPSMMVTFQEGTCGFNIDAKTGKKLNTPGGLKYKLKESAAKSATPGTKNPGATLGPGPAAGPDGVTDNAYTKQFKFQLVPKNKDGTYVQKGSGMIVKKLF